MNVITILRAGSTVLSVLIFAGIVWWAYGARRKSSFEVAAHSVLHDEDTPLGTHRTTENSL